MGAFAKFYFRPSKGEWINTRVEPENSGDCGIIGLVTQGGEALPGAMVLLYEGQSDQTEPLSQTVTGQDGRFVFGPLRGGQLYEARVYKDGIKLRQLEISV